MGHFASYVKPTAIKPFFAKAGLQWETGRHLCSTERRCATKLPPQYSQKAVFVKNVAHADAWYHMDESSVVESRVFASTSVNIVGETAVALASIDRGKLGYVGDVNAEKGLDAVIFAMCGL